MTPIQHEEHIGYSRFVEAVECAERWLDGAHASGASDWWGVVLGQLDEADALLADDGPRGCGAAMAQWYREQQGMPTAAALRERAGAILYGAVEASAITGGHVGVEAG